MNAQINATEMAKLNALLIKQASISKKSAQEILKQQAKLLVKDLVKYTYPEANSEAAETPKKRMEIKVGKEIKKSMHGYATKGIRDPEFKERIDKLVNAKDKDSLQQIFEHIPKFNQYRVVDFSPDYHQGDRLSSGTGVLNVKNNKYRITLDNPDLKGYKTRIKNFAGKLKASWLLAANVVGIKLPMWISRHSAYATTVGKVVYNDNEENPNIKIYNSANPTSYIISVVNRCLQYRARAMYRDLEHKLKYANK